jgi:hypothetical protein
MICFQYRFLSLKYDFTPFSLGQESAQKFLLVVAAISVPWMLLAKPFLEHRHHKQEYEKFSNESHHGPSSVHPRKYDFTEEMVHQIIHTIEVWIFDYFFLWQYCPSDRFSFQQNQSIFYPIVHSIHYNYFSLFGSLFLAPSPTLLHIYGFGRYPLLILNCQQCSGRKQWSQL